MPVKAHQASDYLKTPEDVAAYLNAAIEEIGEDPRLLMKALRKHKAACRRWRGTPSWTGSRCLAPCQAGAIPGWTPSPKSPPRVASSSSFRRNMGTLAGRLRYELRPDWPSFCSSPSALPPQGAAETPLIQPIPRRL